MSGVPSVPERRTSRPTPPWRAARTSGRPAWSSIWATSSGLRSESASTRPSGAMTVTREVGRRAEARLNGLDGHALETSGEIHAHEHHGHRDEAHERQGELEGDAAAEGVDEPAEHHVMGSRRYPTLLTVRIRRPSGPSFTRSRRTCTSTVLDSISPARE